MIQKKYYVKGMHCSSCEIYIDSKLNKIEGISNIKSNSKQKSVEFELNKNISEKKLVEDINKDIEKDGYLLVKERVEEKKNFKNILPSILLAGLVILLFQYIQKLGIGGSLFQDEINYPTIFLIGIVASISSCMAVVGSLILSMSSLVAKEKNNFKTLVSFHISRFVSFFVLGGLLGLIGTLFKINSLVEITISVLIFALMVIFSINLLNISTPLNKMSPTFTKSFFSKSLKKIKFDTLLGPLLLGFLTFFLPCGFTQAMQLNAVVSGNFLQAALVMTVFALGTFPALLLITIGSKKIGEGKNSDLFFKIAGFLVLYFAIYNLIGTLIANGIIKPFN